MSIDTTVEAASSPLPDPWKNIRDEFPALHQSVKGKPLIYFDNAATVQKPRRVIEALADFYRRDNANVHRGLHALSMRATDAYEGARGRVARFLGAAAPEEIIFTRGTTEAINLVAAAWGAAHLRSGDVILLTEMEHHSNIVPWQLIAQRTGAQLRYLPVTGDDGLLDLSQLDRLLTPEVKVFAFTHASNTLGTINPVAELCAQARRVGAITVVDGAQAAGHLPVDVRALGCDFYAISGHKMCAPTGIGALYGRQALLDAMPPYQGGGGMIEHVDLLSSRWKPAPERFEAGTPNFADAYAFGVACDYIDALDRRRVAAHDQRLGQLAYDRLASIPGIRLLGPARGRGGVVSFAFANVHAHDVVTFADEDGVALRGGHHCNQPLMRRLGLTSTARASFYVYNTEAEIEPLTASLRRIVRFFS
ncbi:MAG TPA: cysteine desulfurase [Opitutaceae bacterium]|jgi:cysteine desulfurase/selenocysteine lyase|nr:cysteine desulfurase [Opitutaceae bacterium]